jgi:anti-sigma B factor antagonist
MPREAGERISAPPALAVVRELDGDVAIVHARGELDLATAPLLCRAINAATGEARRPRVLVDLAEVDFCDSAGLRALLGAAREVEARAGRLVVAVQPGTAVDRLLELVGVREFLRVMAPDQARAAL